MDSIVVATFNLSICTRVPGSTRFVPRIAGIYPEWRGYEVHNFLGLQMISAAAIAAFHKIDAPVLKKPGHNFSFDQ